MVMGTMVGVETLAKKTHEESKKVRWPKGLVGGIKSLGAVPISLADEVMETEGQYLAPAGASRALAAVVARRKTKLSTDTVDAAWVIIMLRTGGA